MRRDIRIYANRQVFLNHPFDSQFAPLAEAMEFAVVAAGLLPVSAHDLTSPDRLRLDMLIEAVQHCRYSAHDFSRFEGAGTNNFARMNMPLEMGMALAYALQTQRNEHRCAFFVPTETDYRLFVSDLAGLDPKVHNNDQDRMLIGMYEWLRDVVAPNSIFNSRPVAEIVDKFKIFTRKKGRLRGSGVDGRPSYGEKRELMYQICGECGWWEWRATRVGKEDFPEIPLAYSD